MLRRVIRMFTAKIRSQKCTIKIEDTKNKSDFKNPDSFQQSSIPSEHDANHNLNVATSTRPMSPSLSFSDISWSEPMNELFNACVQEIQLIWINYKRLTGGVDTYIQQKTLDTSSEMMDSTIISHIQESSSRQYESTSSLDCTIDEVNMDYIDDKMKNLIEAELEILPMVCILLTCKLLSFNLFCTLSC